MIRFHGWLLLMGLCIGALLFAGTATMAAEPPGFAQPPSAKASGDKVTISFSVKTSCDAAVWVEDGAGKIVRHIAAGMLGENPPEPFKKGLGQELEWEGKDDAGQPAPAGCKVKVGLGLGTKFDKILGWNGQKIGWVQGFDLGPKGEIYVLTTNETYFTSPTVQVFTREGKYLRTIMPYPANLPDEAIAGLGFVSFPGQGRQPKIHDTLYLDLYPGYNSDFSTCGNSLTVLPDGRVALVGPLGWLHGDGRLLLIGADGSVPKGSYLGPLLSAKSADGRVHLCLSPDGKRIYFSGLRQNQKGKEAARPVIYRTTWEEKGEPAVFAGEAGQEGSDEKHFNDPRGLAIDPEGRLYVADHFNHRVVALDPEGKFIGAATVEFPDKVAVHPKTGAIYVLTATSRDEKETPANWYGRAWEVKKLIKLDGLKNGRQEWSVDLPRCFSSGNLVLDAGVDPPVLLVGGIPGGLVQFVDRGAKAEEPKELFPYQQGLCRPMYLAVDRAREELYVRDYSDRIGWVRFDGRTGTRQDLKFKESPSAGPSDVAVGPDGFLYFANREGVVARFDRDEKPVPFAATGKNEIGFPGDELGRGEKSRGVRGLCVSPAGDVYALLYASGHTSKQTYVALDVFDAKGARKFERMLKMSVFAGGVRVDRQGNIYVSDTNGKLRDAFKGVADLPKCYQRANGSLFKFTPPGAGGEPKLLWEYPEVSTSGSSRDCACFTPRFDLDGFGRIFTPDVLRFSVTVLDAGGNALGRFGGYGNMDSQGPGSSVPSPEISLGWPQHVAVSDEAVYVSDMLNRRVLRAKLVYAATAECPAP
ncbi:MAG: hypothetical protein V1809_04510 [Planctomycetota bacterium]